MDKLIKRANRLASESAKPIYPIPKRIAYVVSHGQSYTSHGYAIRTHAIASALNHQGLEALCFVRPGRPWELEGVSNDIQPEVELDGVRYVHTRWSDIPSTKRERLERSVERFMELFRVYRPSVILAASNYVVGLPAWVAARRLGIPFHYEVRGFWELSRAAADPSYENCDDFNAERERDAFLAQQAIKVFTLNQPMKDELVQRGVAGCKIELVPNGLAAQPEIKLASVDLQKKLGISSKDKVIGYIGSFTAYEGLDLLLDACRQLIKQGESVKLLLVGDDQPVTLTSSWGKQFADQPWLIQVGRVPHTELIDYYALVDTVVVPRQKLPVCELVPPFKIVEALAYGKCLVVSDVKPLLDYAQRYDNVASFESGSVKDLAEVLQLSLNQSELCIANKFQASIGVQTIIDASQGQRGSELGHLIQSDDMQTKKKLRSTQHEFAVNGVGALTVGFKLISEELFADLKFIFGIVILDADGNVLDSDSYSRLNYSHSSSFGNYKYLSANSVGTAYAFAIDLPEGARRCVVTTGCKLRGGVSLRGELSVSHFSGLTEYGPESVDFKSEIDNFKYNEALWPRFSLTAKHTTMVLKVLEHFSDTSLIKPIVLWDLWRITNDPFLFNKARFLFVHQGRMYEERQLCDEIDALNGCRAGNYSARRVNDEIKLLENGFDFPVRARSCSYLPKNNILYLLHNRLPYNSGGYATRTHGLLTGIQGLGGFKMHGVSRPGYPSDHRKHIGVSIPSPVPFLDLIDGVEYYSLDQNVRRSALTVTEYVEKYATCVQDLAVKKNASVIHAAANFPNGLAASLAARRLGIKSVYEVRGLWEITRMSRQEGWDETDQFRYMAKMEAEACNAADEVITITEALKDLMISRGVDGSKITVVPNCVHTDLFSPQCKDIKLAGKLGIDEHDVVIGYVGSIVNYEGLDDLLSVLALLVKDGVTNFKFLLVGDGAVLDELKQQIIELSIEGYVIITGRVPHEEVQRYYSLVDIAPFPRKPYAVCEAVSPLKPFEAMASGKAVIVSSCSALTEIITDGFNGLVFRKGDLNSFKSVLGALIGDQDLRLRVAETGRRWVINERDWSMSSEKVEAIYNRLITY
jgi:glycosyltransferase involved in cell wall biosynthesis